MYNDFIQATVMDKDYIKLLNEQLAVQSVTGCSGPTGGRSMKRARSMGAMLGLVLLGALPPHAAYADEQASATQIPDLSRDSSFEGLVEAERQTTLAAQVSGAVIEIAVKPGDTVKAGQLLVRLDAQAASQTAAVSEAQVQAAQASLAVAQRDFDRQKQLFAQDYISQAALDRAEARYKASEAETRAQIAQAGAARTQAGFYTIRAPYAGVVAEVPVNPGDMAMPGRPLVTVYDPSALRLTATVPQAAVSSSLAGAPIAVELPGDGKAHRWITPSYVKVLPTVDPATHTMQIRLGLPKGKEEAVPGTFGRVWLPTTEKLAGVPLKVPAAAIVKRAEMTGLYVLDANNHPILRQVRLGRVLGDQVEVLSGIAPEDKVVQDAQALSATR
jgi:multidrug efflux system membrane fusion protein